MHLSKHMDFCLGQDTHRAKKAVRVILLAMIITVSILHGSDDINEVSGSPNTLNQTDIHDPARYAGKRLSERTDCSF